MVTGVEDRISVTTDASGRRVMAKVAGDPEQATRLQNEAALLEAGRHPGVAELVGVEGHGVGSVLLTAHVEGLTAAEVGPMALEEAAGVTAALATTVADLHDLGLLHGAICPDHILIGPEGRPVLCSLGYGGRIGERPPPAPALPEGFVDPARATLERFSPAIDVFGLGALARFLAPSPPAGHPLARVVLAATSEDPSLRPPARALAEWLHAGPAARLPRRSHPQPPPPAGPPPPLADPLAAWRQERSGAGGRRRPAFREAAARHPKAKVLAGGGAALVVAAGALALMAGGRPAPPPTAAKPLPGVSEEAPSGPPTTRAGSAPSTTLATAAGPRQDCPPVTAVLQADVDGDGCPEAVRYTGGVLEAGGVKWSLGQPGDQVATGDWGCQGRRTVALFRPATGQLFRFEGWASPGRDLTAAVVARVEGGLVLRAADLDRDGCHEAVVERGAGLPPEVLRLPPARP